MIRIQDKFRNVAVGVSGGVDSAVVCLLLKAKGFNVIGVFMKNWDETDETGKCSLSQDRADAEKVCRTLQIPFHEVNFVKKFWLEVFSKFLKEYQSGLTPNPDILCNRYIKFHAFSSYCLDTLRVDAVATGHYAKTSFGSYLQLWNPHKDAYLLKAVDQVKDQTFFLSRVSRKSLNHVMFPVGGLTKSQVRDIAAKNDLLNVKEKKDSTGICFIGQRRFQDFISEYISNNPGPVVDLTSGKHIDQHQGFHLWTIGQCARLAGFPSRYYVARKNLEENTMYVVPGTKHPSLFSYVLFASSPHWITTMNLSKVLKCDFRFQQSKPATPCRVLVMSQRIVIILDHPLKAVTPGQYAILYKRQVCLGSVRITFPGPSLFTLKNFASH